MKRIVEKLWLASPVGAGSVLLASACAPAEAPVRYEPTVESLSQREVPEWFREAKLGMFVNWGLYSVPGYAPTTGPLPEVIERDGWHGWFLNNPYAEWYWNSMQIEGSPTRAFHEREYGADFTYDDFAPMLREAVTRLDPEDWAALFERAHARYFVFDVKHHDGFLLWPSRHPNPHKEGWQVERDLPGDLARAVRARGIRFGIYYSGGIDWTFNPLVIRDVEDLPASIPQGEEYGAYADAHWRELIDRYSPAVLWNDIGYPAAGQVLKIFAHYYNQVPDGVINNRWNQGADPLDPFTGAQPHYDFTTPEYAVLDTISHEMWESTRGIGFSFGYNRNEDVASFLSVAELVYLFVDIVSKGGNLLLNVAPKADGTMQPEQVERLLGLGAWLDTNGEAIFGTRPWDVAEGLRDDGPSVRFTRKGDALYAILLGTPDDQQVAIRGLMPAAGTEVHLLGHDHSLSWAAESGGIRVELPALPDAPAHTLRFQPAPTWGS